MGNQPSKQGEGGNGKAGSKTAADKSGRDLASYPSMSKSDTKDSTRSIRNSIRSKIPGGGSSKLSQEISRDSSTSGAKSEGVAEGFDAAAPRAGSQNRGTRSSRAVSASSVASRESMLSVATTSVDPDTPKTDDFEPPPSPTISKSFGKQHQAAKDAQDSGEVDQVSDDTSKGAARPSSLDRPGESILVKREGQINPVGPDTTLSPVSEDGSAIIQPSIGALSSLDLDDMITRLLDAGYAGKVTKAVCLKNAEITAICQAASQLFLSQPALVELSTPVKIVGDVHGQYTDLLRMFEMCGFPPNANFLFLGDYVDRGKQSLETILLLLCYKLKFPENFFLLRGNHECANVTRVYGFYDECKRRCNIKVWRTFIDCFNTLPIAAIVAGKIFCVHGGLSPSLKHMDDIRNIRRPTDVPDYGLLNDLLWSDPADIDNDWEASERGVSYCFGKKVIMDFLQRHDFDLVCRAHMVVEDGYEFFNDRILVTVFSAPNVRPYPFPDYPPFLKRWPNAFADVRYWEIIVLRRVR